MLSFLKTFLMFQPQLGGHPQEVVVLLHTQNNPIPPPIIASIVEAPSESFKKTDHHLIAQKYNFSK